MLTRPNQSVVTSLSSIESISALTLATRDMARALAFYESLGLQIVHGGATSPFTSLRAGNGYVNLTLETEREWSWWGRAIFYVSDVDAMYRRAIDAGLQTYTVRNGDSLTSIASKFNLPEELIMEINNLSSRQLVEGQEIKIYLTL